MPKLFKENHTVHNLELKIELKPDHKPVQQKGRRIPIHLQKWVNIELNRLINSGHLTRTNDIQQTKFLLPTVITVKKDNSVNLAMDTRILNDITSKRKPQMPTRASFAIYNQGRNPSFIHPNYRFRIRVRTDKVTPGDKKTLQHRNNRRRSYRIVPI